MSEDTHIAVPTLDDYRVIIAASQRFVACRVAEDLMRENALMDMVSMGYVPLSERPWYERWPVMLRRAFVIPIGTVLIRAGIALGGENPSDHY